MNKRGFTLMELMVYMAIVGIVVVIAGQVYSDSTKMRVRTQNMLKASEVAENTGSLFKDDVAQMGAKSAVSSGTPYAFKAGVLMHPLDADETKKDSSSFFISAGKDSLALRRLKYEANGSFKSIEEVSWYSKNDKLWRSCKTLEGSADGDLCPKDNPNVVEIADGIETFRVTPAKPSSFSKDALLFPYDISDLTNKKFRFVSYYGKDNFVRIVTDPEAGATSVSLAGFATNFNSSGTAPSDPIKHMVFLAPSGSTTEGWNTNCQQFTFKKDSVYEVSFTMDNNDDEARMFRPGVDHMAMGIRAVGDGDPTKVADVDDFMFYPPGAYSGTGLRAMRFSTHLGDVTACIAFTFAFYSPTVNMGKISIKDLQVKQISETYIFDDSYVAEADVQGKKDIRAFQLELVVKKGSATKPERGSVKMVVPVPSNGVEN